METDSAAVKKSDMPDEIRGWNWGAFFMSWIWAICNGVWVGLIAFLPIICTQISIHLLARGNKAYPYVFAFGIIGWLATSIYLGINGSRLAWRNRKWQSVEHFKAARRRWSIAGGVLFSLLVIFVVLLCLGISLLMSGGLGNSRDNAIPAKQQEMKQILLKTGNLSSIPPEAKIAFIRTEGGSFSRSFRMKFYANPEVVKKWLADSPGTRHITPEQTEDGGYKYELKPMDGYNYASVSVNCDFTGVVVYVSWS